MRIVRETIIQRGVSVFSITGRERELVVRVEFSVNVCRSFAPPVASRTIGCIDKLLGTHPLAAYHVTSTFYFTKFSIISPCTLSLPSNL